MALSLTAKMLSPGETDQQVLLSVVLDGTLTTASALALPVPFPQFAAANGPAAGNTSAQLQAGKRVIYMPAFGGTSSQTVTSIIPNAATPGSVDIVVSGAGTAGQTINLLAIIKDQGF